MNDIGSDSELKISGKRLQELNSEIVGLQYKISQYPYRKAMYRESGNGEKEIALEVEYEVNSERLNVVKKEYNSLDENIRSYCGY